MEYKVVVSDPKSGKSYQVSIKDEQAKKVRGRKVGDALEGAVVGLPGYKLEITGGSDRGGFAMRAGVHSPGATRVLTGSGVGYRPRKGVRSRRRIHGETVGDDVVQVNTKIVEYGGKGVEELLGVGKAGEAGGAGGASAGKVVEGGG